MCKTNHFQQHRQLLQPPLLLLLLNISINHDLSLLSEQLPSLIRPNILIPFRLIYFMFSQIYYLLVLGVDESFDLLEVVTSILLGSEVDVLLDVVVFVVVVLKAIAHDDVFWIQRELFDC